MTSKISYIIEQIGQLSLLEALELSNSLESIFRIEKKVTLEPMSSSLKIESGENEISAKNSYEIFLVSLSQDKKISVLKSVRNLTGLGLKESKELVDNLPGFIKKVSNIEEAETIKKEIEASGGTAEIR